MTPETTELLEVIERLYTLDSSMPPQSSATQFPTYYTHGAVKDTISVLCVALQDRLAPNRPKDVGTSPDPFGTFNPYRKESR